MLRPTPCKCWNSSLNRTEYNGQPDHVTHLGFKILNCGHNRYQQLEGTLNELCEHNLPAGETKEQLLNERGNSVAFWQVEPFG